MFACSGNHDAGGRGLHWVADAFDTPFALWSGKLIDFLQWWWRGRAESIRRKVYPTVYAGVSNDGVIRCHFPPLRRWLWCLLQGKDLLGENFIWLVGWAMTVSSTSCPSWRRRLGNPLTRHSLANAEPVLWKIEDKYSKSDIKFLSRRRWNGLRMNQDSARLIMDDEEEEEQSLVFNFFSLS